MFCKSGGVAFDRAVVAVWILKRDRLEWFPVDSTMTPLLFMTAPQISSGEIMALS